MVRGSISKQEKMAATVKKDNDNLVPDVASEASYKNPTTRANVVSMLLDQARKDATAMLSEYHDLVTWNHATGGSARSCYPSFQKFAKEYVKSMGRPEPPSFGSSGQV